MKTNLSIIFLVVIFAISLNEVHAQDAKVGIKGGASLYSSTLSINIDVPELGNISEEETSSSKVGFGVGLFVEKPFSDFVSAQFEALYVQKGGKDEVSGEDIDTDIDASDGDLTLSYIDVPVLLKVNIPLDSNVSPFVYGGGFAGYLLDAKAEADGESTDDFGIEIKDLLTDLNYGIVFGAGLNFGSISLDIRYDLGLANIFDSESDLIQDLLEEVGDTGEADQIQELLDGIEITTSGFLFTVGVSF